MLNPSDGIDGIKSFIIDSVKKAGARGLKELSQLQ